MKLTNLLGILFSLPLAFIVFLSVRTSNPWISGDVTHQIFVVLNLSLAPFCAAGLLHRRLSMAGVVGFTAVGFAWGLAITVNSYGSTALA
jgi:hypothetical protein